MRGNPSISPPIEQSPSLRVLLVNGFPRCWPQLPLQGRKVRRSTPLVEPQDIEERTVYVENVPQDTTVETMERDFGCCGSVEYIQLEESSS